jgi:Asp-tRNA(Asn)/Glu-tRNA(Gln) amidotransferase A subunit family amidase
MAGAEFPRREFETTLQPAKNKGNAMISFEDYVGADAVAWAERVRSKDVSALELAEAAIARAEAVNPEINAIVAKTYDMARAQASTPQDGPFAGVPWAIKDMYQTVEGVPLTNGSRAYKDVVGKSDAELVRRYKRAGLNIVCTSTAPEFAIAATTESTLHGLTRNPWDLSRTSGGSSGGASALVSAGVMPAAHATDGGGSIRGPASCCGLFGLKPSRGRVPIAPGRTEGWFGCSTGHAVTRSVRDSAVLLDVSHGPELGSRYVAPPPKDTFLAATKRDPGKLRIAYHWETRPSVTADPECIAAVEAAAKLCADLGHIVEPAAPKLDYDGLARAFGRAVVTAVAAAIDGRLAELGVASIDEMLEQTTREYAAYARGITAVQLNAANNTFMSAALAVAEFQQTYDVILSPTMGRPPVKLGVASLMQPAALCDAGTIPFSCFTALQNQTGQPAMTVPLYWTKENLPVGVQFAGRMGEEELLLSLAAQLEKAQPWFDKRPPL